MEIDVEAILREESGGVSGMSTHDEPAGEPKADEETSSPSKKSVPRSAKAKQSMRYVTVRLPESASQKLQTIQASHWLEGGERLSLGAVIERLIDAGVSSAFGEKVARKVTKSK